MGIAMAILDALLLAFTSWSTSYGIILEAKPDAPPLQARLCLVCKGALHGSDLRLQLSKLLLHREERRREGW